MKRVASLLLLVSCYIPPEKVAVHVDLPLELVGGAEQLTVRPRIAEARRVVSRAFVTLDLKRDTGKVRIELPGACPLFVDTRSLAGGARLSLQSLFDVGPPERVVGSRRRFELVAVPLCQEGAAAQTTFEVAEGAELDDVQHRPRAFAATTRAAVAELDQAPGIVPVSARVSRGLRTSLTFRVRLPSGETIERVLGVSAVARSSGLPEVGLNHPVLLSGEGWRLSEKPAMSQAQLRRAGNLFELVPDQAGRYRLQDDLGRKLSLQSERYDRVPLDCGRSNCHAEIAHSALGSPMAQTLASDLGGCHTLSEPECATACHATGEPGVHDGGFTQVMAELGMRTLPAEYEELPHALRGLGGVGCMACHGPTQTPEPESRFAILKNDVCAVCHDAPPRYGHLRALQSSRMGRTSDELATRREPCARCHTTWGALERPAPPEHAQGGGLACVTCHDVHPHGSGPQDGVPAAPSHPGLLRRLPLPSGAAQLPATLLGASRVCVSCHAPSSDAGPPEASAASILAGKGGFDASSGAALELPSPHTQSPRGCLSCHESGPTSFVMGQSHAFRATESSCVRCHQTSPPRDPKLAQRARDLFGRLAPSGVPLPSRGPWHAHAAPMKLEGPRGRALRNVLLVLEDPASDVHHPRYAGALLDAAATSLSP